MKKALAILAALAVGMLAHPLFAGVVLTQQIVTNSGSNSTTDERTVMVQDNKQKVEMRDQSIVLDLDAGKMILINPAAKTYTELPFPPHGQMAAMMQNMGGVNLDFKKTGKSQTLSGYQCQEYESTAKSAMGEFDARGCFSAQAPGAAAYASFTRELAKKFEEAGMAKTSGNQPDGIPIELRTTTKLTAFNIPGMPPEQAEKLKQMMANRPPTTTKSTTTSIKTADLSADTFGIPAGYTERKVALGAPGMGAPAPGPTPYEGE
jgi:opacity protein-like surface antigen